MGWRTVIVSRHAKLELQSAFMQVRTEDGSQKIIIDELDLLIIENSATSVSVNLLARLAEKNVRVIFCDQRRNPIGELEPYSSAHDCLRKYRQQTAWSEEAKGLVWQRIIREKIANQARTLELAGMEEAGKILLCELERIQPYDEGNVEGMSARYYFSALFDLKFRRGDSSPINAALDYGYTVLLSAFNRCVAAHGYLSILGIFHHNIYNRWNLGCDLMEPYRPYIDFTVYEMLMDEMTEFGKLEKRRLVESLHAVRTIAGEKKTVMSGIDDYVLSVVAALDSVEPERIVFPEF